MVRIVEGKKDLLGSIQPRPATPHHVPRSYSLALMDSPLRYASEH